MANGDQIQVNKLFAIFALLDAETGTTDGVWVDTGLFERASFHLEIGAGTLQIRGSNNPTKPADNTHGFQIGADKTATAEIGTSILPRWVKARVTVDTSG
ncbi:hypothetical protein LCGC14_3098630, partial [marine sediment metagenome]